MPNTSRQLSGAETVASSEAAATRTPAAFAAPAARPSSDNCLPVGTRLNDFEITGVIGEGGFGIVYSAFDHSLRRNIAIKEYMPGALAWRGASNTVLLRSEHHRNTFQTGLESFINEARLLAQLEHPALVRVYRFWEENNTGYMVMRHYEGRTLQAVVKDQPALVSNAWLTSVLEQVLEALEALHDVDILHRDISPENILILENGAPVLLDFGAARKIIGDMTQALTVILKPGYAPIEQYADDTTMKQGPWTDIYALSGVMYFAIRKKAPPTSIARMIKDPILPLTDESETEFNHLLLAGIDKGLSVRPEDRPQSADQFRVLLGMKSRGSARSAAGRSATPAPAAAPRSTPSSASAVPRKAAVKVSPARPLLPEDWQRHVKNAMAFLASRRKTFGIAGVAVAGLLSFGVHAFFAAPNAATGNEATAAASMPVVEPAKMLAREEVVDEETLAWELLKGNAGASQADVDAFLQKYPAGKYAVNAKARLADMAPAPTAVAAVVAEPVDAKNGQVAAIMQTAVTDDSAKGDGQLAYTITVKPWAMVSVDGVDKGATPPLKRLRLSDGKHRIVLSNPGFDEHVVEIDTAKMKSKTIWYDFSTGPRK